MNKENPIDHLVTCLRALAKAEHDDHSIADEAADVIESLADFVMFYARCPCCEETYECLSECTFEADAPREYATMQMARSALKY